MCCQTALLLPSSLRRNSPSVMSRINNSAVLSLQRQLWRGYRFGNVLLCSPGIFRNQFPETAQTYRQQALARCSLLVIISWHCLTLYVRWQLTNCSFLNCPFPVGGEKRYVSRHEVVSPYIEGALWNWLCNAPGFFCVFLVEIWILQLGSCTGGSPLHSN